VAAYQSGDLNAELKTLRRQLHQTIEKITDDFGRRHSFNTAIAAVMELMNAYGKVDGDDATTRSLRQEVLESVVLLLSPIVPHICQALWAELRAGAAIEDAAWPSADTSALVQDEVELVVQVNGKLRGSITVAKTMAKEAIEQHALAQNFVQKFLEDGSTVRKIIVVPNKLVNIVVG
jgi:leucyl-tRNA synthetase